MKNILLIIMLLVVFAISGCQFDIDGGSYHLPRASAKLLYENEDKGQSESRDTGVFSTGKTIIQSEYPTKNRLPMVK